MLKLLVDIFLLPFRLIGWFIKAVFWIPLILLGFIFDDGGPGAG